MRVQDFLPPVFGKAYRRIRGTRTPADRTYSSFREALLDCGKGYEADELANVILAKTRAFKAALETKSSTTLSPTDAFGILSVAHVLAHGGETRPEIAVLDLGGACGAHYFSFKKFFGPRVRFRWLVVETTTMRRHAEGLANDELSFSDDLESALRTMGTPTLVHLSGVLSFVERPYDTLDRLVKSRAPYLFFNRLAFTAKASDIVSVHRSMLSANGIGPLPAGFVDHEVRYPYVVLARPKFDSLLGPYETVVEFDDRSGISPVNGEPIVGGGLLLKLRED